MMIFCIFLMLFDWLLKKILVFCKDMDVNVLKDKIGIFVENYVMGFIIGGFLGIVVGYDVVKILMLVM